jgi:hypothetical protein
MSIVNLISDSTLGWKGKQPPSQAIVPDSLHFSSSVYGDPAFSSYKQEWIRKLKPTRLAGPRKPVKYLDNLPK